MQHAIKNLSGTTTPEGFDYCRSISEAFSDGIPEGDTKEVRILRPLTGGDLVLSIISTDQARLTLEAAPADTEEWEVVDSLSTVAEEQVLRRYTFDPLAGQILRCRIEGTRACKRISIHFQARS